MTAESIHRLLVRIGGLMESRGRNFDLGDFADGLADAFEIDHEIVIAHGIAPHVIDNQPLVFHHWISTRRALCILIEEIDDDALSAALFQQGWECFTRRLGDSGTTPARESLREAFTSAHYPSLPLIDDRGGANSEARFTNSETAGRDIARGLSL